MFIYTTNKYKVSIRGFNGECSVPYFNWLPRLVQESYVFLQLHYRPEIANYNPRPAVHWFTYQDLCALGRQAGYGQFYSWIDLVQHDNPLLATSGIRRAMFERTAQSAWLRALALTQAGGGIFMLKR